MSGVSQIANFDAPARSEPAPAIKSTLGLLPLIALSAALTGPAVAQDGADISLEQVNVEGGSGNATNTNSTSTGIGRLPGTARSQPQTVNTVSKEVLEEQKVKSLEEALRNVPGVTIRIGEGNGGLNGDQFMVRGFEAKGDIYSDGLRDAGVRSRDAFAYEDVQVLKGPSSESFGMGTTGAAINTRIKRAFLANESSVEGSVGNGFLGRTVIDVNRQISDTSAFRFVGMGQLQNVVERDNVHNHGAGVLATFGTGIGTDLQWDISYLYQYGNKMPDYGVPMVANGAASTANPSMPITEFGIPRSNFYGKQQDHDITHSHALTSNLRWEVNEKFTLYNDTRLSYDMRDFSTSVPSCGSPTATNPIDCVGNFFAGLPTTISGYGGGNPTYIQRSFGFQNITTGVADLDTGSLRHQIVGGIDVYYQNNARDQYGVTGKVLADLYNPAASFNAPYTVSAAPTTIRGGHATNVAAFLSDRVWFTDQFSLLAGLRYDVFDTAFSSTNVGTGVTTAVSYTAGFLSPKASLIWEPTPNQTYYVSWAQSATPPGMFVTNAQNALSAAQAAQTPETANSYEIGGKIDLLEGRLGLTAALYRVDKGNVIYTNPATGLQTLSSDAVRSQGVEIGITGKPTDAWTLTLAYAYNDARIVSSTNAAIIGNRAAFAVPHSFSLWTSYELSRHFDISGKWLIGGGVKYSDGYYTNTANTAFIPANFSLDAFTSYEFDRFKVSLNAYNLTNNLNYAQGWGNRAVVAPGRSFVLSASAKF